MSVSLRKRKFSSATVSALTPLTLSIADEANTTPEPAAVSVSERENSRNLTPCEPVSVSEAPLADAVLTLTAAHLERDRRMTGTDAGPPVPSGPSFTPKQAGRSAPPFEDISEFRISHFRFRIRRTANHRRNEVKKIKTTATFTATLLARELNLTARRVRQLEAEGVLRRLPDNKFDPDECADAYNAFKAGRGSAAMARVRENAGRLADDIDHELGKLSKLSMERRMQEAMAPGGVGEKVGKLIHLLSLMAATAPEGAQRDFEKQHVASLHGVLLGSLLNAIGAELDHGEAA